MKTLLPSQISDADRPFVAARGNADGTVTLYYPGDVIPPLDLGPTVEPGIVVTPRQFRQALTRAGLRTAVDAFVAAQPQDIKDWYEYATEFDSSHPVVAGMALAMGKTPEEVNAVFQLAASL